MKRKPRGVRYHLSVYNSRRSRRGATLDDGPQTLEIFFRAIARFKKFTPSPCGARGNFLKDGKPYFEDGRIV